MQRFEGLLVGLKNTDLLIMVDVTTEAEVFVQKLKNISKEAITCMKKFVNVDGNSVAVMLFSSKSNLIINFDDPCLKDDACLQKLAKKVKYVFFSFLFSYFLSPSLSF